MDTPSERSVKLTFTVGQMLQTLVLLSALAAAWYGLSGDLRELSAETRARLAAIEKRVDRLEDRAP